MLSLKPLGECREFLSLIASWHDDAWGHLRPDKPEYSKKLHEERLNTDCLPITFVVFQEEDPIGMFSLVANTFGIGDPDIAMMNNVYVQRAKRGCGFGKAIVSLAEDTARDRFSLKKIQLGTVVDSLIGFYEKLGWYFTKEDTMGEGHTIYMMEKDISPKVEASATSAP